MGWSKGFFSRAARQALETCGVQRGNPLLPKGLREVSSLAITTHEGGWWERYMRMKRTLNELRVRISSDSELRVG